MGVEIQLFEFGTYRSDGQMDGWMDVCMKSEVYKEKVNTRDELVARIMNSAAFIKKEHQNDLRRATRSIAKRAEKCIEADPMVRLLNTYFELLQFIEIIYITNKCNQ